LLADLFGVAAEKLCDAKGLEALLKESAARSGLHALAEPVVIPFGANASGGHAGVTGFIVLAESHIAFHSYPELGYLAVDVFTCGPNAQPQAALDVFIERLQPARTVVRSYVRGDLSR
jgi:S-adenosylmethionine decarboxylase